MAVADTAAVVPAAVVAVTGFADSAQLVALVGAGAAIAENAAAHLVRNTAARC